MKNEKILFYTPSYSNDICSNNFWIPVEPTKILFMENNKRVDIDKNTYISIRRSRASSRDNIKNVFKPIFNLILCQRLLGNDSIRQSYFDKIYFGMVVINFLFFSFSIAIAQFLVQDGLPTKYIYLVIVFSILINLTITVHLFINHLKLKRCDDEKITLELKDTFEESVNFEYNTIHKFYIVLNDKNRISITDKKEKLASVNSTLSTKLDGVHQLSTPILFLSQVTIAISLISYFYK